MTDREFIKDILNDLEIAEDPGVILHLQDKIKKHLTTELPVPSAMEELMDYYQAKEFDAEKRGKSETSWYYGGIVEGMNKAWKLLDGASVEEVKG